MESISSVKIVFRLSEFYIVYGIRSCEIVKDRNTCFHRNFYFYCIANGINFQEKHKIFTEDLREIHVFLTIFIYNKENTTETDIKETQRKDFQV